MYTAATAAPGCCCLAAAPVVIWQLQLLSLHKRPAALVRHVVDDKHSSRKFHLLIVPVVRLQDNQDQQQCLIGVVLSECAASG
jgi:hypothetical protein